ncbi:MAG: hypothetical protein K2Q14_03275 [Gammaproteobacteria bacterium]|nr:hypothetical protein [Gammaproteobacteria bacterium]
MMTSNLANEYILEYDYAHLIHKRREKYPNLLELVEIKTPWNIIEEILSGHYENIDENIKDSLPEDVLRITAARLW